MGHYSCPEATFINNIMHEMKWRKSESDEEWLQSVTIELKPVEPEGNLSHSLSLFLGHRSHLHTICKQSSKSLLVKQHVLQFQHCDCDLHLIKDPPSCLLISQLTPVWTGLDIFCCARSTLGGIYISPLQLNWGIFLDFGDPLKIQQNSLPDF